MRNTLLTKIGLSDDSKNLVVRQVLDSLPQDLERMCCADVRDLLVTAFSSADFYVRKFSVFPEPHGSDIGHVGRKNQQGHTVCEVDGMVCDPFHPEPKWVPLNEYLKRTYKPAPGVTLRVVYDA